MKIFLAFIAFFAVTLAAQAAYVYKSRAIAHRECQVDNHIEESLLVKLIIGQPVHDQNIGAHVLCMNVKVGIQKQNGDIEVETLRHYLTHLIHGDEILTETMAKFGVRAHGSTPEEAAITLLKGIVKTVSDEHAADEKSSTQFYTECETKNKNHIDHSAMRKVIKGESVYDDTIGAHVHCLNVKLGLQKENGDIEIEPLRKRLTPLIHDTETVNNIIAKIGVESKGSTPNKAAIILLRGIEEGVQRN